MVDWFEGYLGSLEGCDFGGGDKLKRASFLVLSFFVVGVGEGVLMR